MRILTVLSTFPPHSYGGGEISAFNFAAWLAKQGHEVGVITMAGADEPELHGEMLHGMRVWRLRFPRPYTYWNHVGQSKWLKPLWYLQDHFDPRNRRMMAKVLDEFRPEFANIHVVSGIGYNALRELGKRDIPALYHLHDLNLVCMWGGMFKKGKTCAKPCAECTCASKVRLADVKSIGRLGFRGNSKANLARVAAFAGIEAYPQAAIINPNVYPAATRKKVPAKHLRLLFVGRVHRSKGIDVVLDALEGLAGSHKFSIDIIGDGADRAALEARYGHHAWCRFRGHQTQAEVSNAMAEADVLCVPSVWEEPLGGVVIQGLLQGLPVLASRVGGIPELVDDGKNGRLLPPGDVAAWKDAIAQVLKAPATLKGWSAHAKAHAHRFDQDHVARETFAFMQKIVAMKPVK